MASFAPSASVPLFRYSPHPELRDDQEKPTVSWASKEKAWRARKTPEGLEALDSADQKLREIGSKRTGGSGKAPF